MKEPNIIWIMSDQHRADAIGIENNWLHTPNLDKLAGKSGQEQSGMIFRKNLQEQKERQMQHWIF